MEENKNVSPISRILESNSHKDQNILLPTNVLYTCSGILHALILFTLYILFLQYFMMLSYKGMKSYYLVFSPAFY
jgi:hypothetical protein